MEFRRLLHPLPLFLIVLFAAVAIVDLVQKIGEDPLPPPKLVGSAVPRFEALEPVIDFRPDRADPTVELLPAPELAQDQWTAPERRGVWARSAAAEVGLELATGGHRVLILECLPARGRHSVGALQVAVNGADCGVIALVPEWRRYRLVLPQGVVRTGLNRIIFGFPDRDRAERPRRALLIRRFGLLLDESAGVEAFDVAHPVSLNAEDERLTIRRSGTFEIPLVLDDWTDALQMRYRFPSGVGRAEVEVVQQGKGGGAIDNAMRASVSADRKPSGRVRISLHGRRGDYLLRIHADLGPLDSHLRISSLRLVEEGDPTRRPWAKNQPRN